MSTVEARIVGAESVLVHAIGPSPDIAEWNRDDMADEQTIKLCECGCGQPSPLAVVTSKPKGWIKGQPTRFIHNHHRTHTGDIWEAMQARCVWVGACLVWQGATSKAGYGQIRVKGRLLYTHRVAFERVNGPVPDGLQLDHVKDRGCQYRACCNEAHLEAVTSRENALRAVRFRMR